MKTTAHIHDRKILGRLVLVSAFLAGALQAPTARAQNGTWISPTGGSWANPAAWLGGAIASGTDATADFSTLSLTADATVTLDGGQTIGNLIFADDSGAHNWFLNTGAGDPLTLSVSVGSPTISVTNQTATLGLALAGSQGLSQNGNGTLILQQPVGFTGGITNNAGTLWLMGTFRTYKATPLMINAGVVQSGGTLNLACNQGSSSASTDVAGAGTLKLVATTNSASSPDLYFDPDQVSNSYYGSKIVAGTLDLGSLQRFIFSKSGHNSVATYRNNEDARINSSIIGSGGITYIAQMTYAGAPPMEVPLVLAGSNAFTGTVEIQRGSIYLLNNFALVQTNKLLMDPASGNNAKFFLYGSGATVANLQSSGSGTAYIANGNWANKTANIAASSLTVMQTSNTTFGGFLVDTNTEYDTGSFRSGPLGLTKNGPGTLTLTAANIYSGPTTINAGALVISMQRGGGTFTVADGATLGVNVTAPTNVPMSSLTLGNSGATSLALTFSGAPSTATPVITTTSLTANGGANAVAINLAFNGAVSVGQFPLIGYGAAGIGGTGFSAFKLASLPSYLTASLVNNTASNSIDLKITGVATPEWSGLFSSEWSTNKITAPKNWVFVTDGKTPTDYADGNAVLFNDVATGTAVDVSVANVAPLSLSFNNNTKSFTLTGSKSITGATGLTKTGTGLVTIGSSNSFTGPVVISAGMVSVTSDAALGAVPATANPGAILLNAGALSAAANLSLAANRGLSLGPSSGAGSGTLDAGGGATLIVNGVLTNNGVGAGSLLKTGAGQVVLANTPAYSGGTSNGAGTLTLLQNQSFARGALLGIASNSVVQSAGTLSLIVDATSTIADITGNGLLRLISTNNNAGSPDLYFGPNHSGTTDWAARLGTALDLGSVQRFIYGKTGHNGVGQYGLAGGDCQFAGPITGSGGLTLIAQNSYTGSNPMEVPFCLNASNSFTGPVELQRGSIYLGNAHAFPAGNVLTFNVGGTDNGRFFLYGNNATVADLSATNTGTVIIADGNLSPGNVGPATLTVIQNNSAVFNGSINDVQAEYGGSGSLNPSLSLVKSGPATLTLAGSCAYSGATTVSAGILALGPGLTLSSPTITIQPGAMLDVTASGLLIGLNGPQTLTAGRPSGAGTDINGSMASTSTINVAGNGVAGTLTINGDLSLQGGTLYLDLAGVSTAGAGVNDLISVTGNLNLSGQTALVINLLAGHLAVGTYTLIRASAVNGDPSNLLLSLPAGARESYALDTATVPGSVLLRVTGSPPAALVWSGTNSSAWDLSTVDWRNGAVPDRFYNLDDVTFDDTSTNGHVILSGSVQPFSVLVNNHTTQYVLDGTGSIDGPGSLTKTGAGTLVLLNSNTYSGLTLIQSGTVQVDNGSTNAALGFGPVTNNATLAFDRSDVVGITNIISGTGTLEQIGAGTLELLGANNYSGPTLISAGLLQLDVGGTTGTLGTGPVTNNAALILDRSDSALTLSNAIAGSGSLSNLLGTVTLAGASTYGGGTWIESGTLVAASPTAFGTGTVTIDSGSLYFGFPSGTTNVIANNIILPGISTQEFTFLGGPTNFLTVRLTGVISGGSPGTEYNLNDTGVSGNDFNILIFDNPNNTFQGNILNNRGTLGFTSDAALGDPSNAILDDSWNINGALRFEANNITLNAGRAITLSPSSGGTAYLQPIDVQGFTGTIAGPISGVGQLVKQGSGTLILTGDETYTGATTVSNGTLTVNGSLDATASVTVVPNTTLSGTGIVGAAVTLYGAVAPGSGKVGTLTTGSQTWYDGGELVFSLSSAANSADWSLLNITNALTIQASSLFTIKLVSVSAAGAPAALPDFNPASAYSWTIATATAGIVGFNPALFTVDTSAFANASHGIFSVTASGNSLVLVYTPITQPPVVSGVQHRSDGNFRINLTGPLGTPFTVHASTNVAVRPASTWPIVGSGVLGSGTTPFDDLTATNYPMRFYRISTP